jgi:hypothetical protein
VPTFLTQGKHKKDEFQEYIVKVKNTVKSVPKNNFIITGSDLNAVIRVAPKRHTHHHHPMNMASFGATRQ